MAAWIPASAGRPSAALRERLRGPVGLARRPTRTLGRIVDVTQLKYRCPPGRLPPSRTKQPSS
jgi:hypothetical protein